MQPSLFTRLAVVESELRAMKDTIVELKVNQDELRRDRDEMAMATTGASLAPTAGGVVAVALADRSAPRRWRRPFRMCLVHRPARIRRLSRLDVQAEIFRAASGSLGRMSKMGNRLLRKLLAVGAHAAL